MALRIIAGDLKGRKLRSVHGTKTRPTTNRTREAIFNILAVWNEFILANLILSDKALMPLQRGLMVFQGAHITQYPLLMAGIVITIFPVILVYLFLQKYIIQGITAGAVKG